jgi:NADH dehydrogenase FAD-containing subunit
VYAAGDAATPIVAPGSPVPMGCKSAMPMAAHAAENAAAALLGRPERRFDWRHPGICLSLGRRDGMIQLVRVDSSPSGFRLTGRIAAWVKERVCRFVVGAYRFERRGLGYRWLTTGRAPLMLRERTE